MSSMNTIETPGADLIQEVAALATNAHAPDDVVTADGELVARTYIVPEGYKLENVHVDILTEGSAAGPRRKRGTYVTRDVESFVTYLNKHAGPDPEVWRNDTGALAVLDAHEASDTRWEEHRLVLQLQHSPEWLAWTRISGKLLSQTVFAEFIEDHAIDVLNPDAATMLEVAQSLQANTRVEFASAVRLIDGQRRFEFKETTQARAGQKGELEIPAKLGLGLRVFIGGQPIGVSARFRYRVNDGALALGVVLDQVDTIVEAAQDLVAEEIREGIDRGRILRGTPA